MAAADASGRCRLAYLLVLGRSGPWLTDACPPRPRDHGREREDDGDRAVETRTGSGCVIARRIIAWNRRQARPDERSHNAYFP
jgi:hypothetical protein